MSPRGWYRGRGVSERPSRGLGPALTKLALYGLTLTMLLSFWSHLSEGAAGCYSQVSDHGQQGLTTQDLPAPESTKEERPAGVVPVRVKLSPSTVARPED